MEDAGACAKLCASLLRHLKVKVGLLGYGLELGMGFRLGPELEFSLEIWLTALVGLEEGRGLRPSTSACQHDIVNDRSVPFATEERDFLSHVREERRERTPCEVGVRFWK